MNDIITIKFKTVDVILINVFDLIFSVQLIHLKQLLLRHKKINVFLRAIPNRLFFNQNTFIKIKPIPDDVSFAVFDLELNKLGHF